MTSPYCASDIQSDEGYAEALPDGRCRAYPDPLTHAEPWTVGFGSTGPDIGPDTIWTAGQARIRCAQYIAEIEADLDRLIPWWRGMCDVRQDVLVNAAYNMGVHGLLDFHHALAAMQAHDYATAADQLLASEWAGQVPHRAQRLALQMRTGERARQPA